MGDESFDMPPAKRRRTASVSAEYKQNSSRIFTPFRTLGLVSPTPVPFTSVPLGKKTFQITTSVGQSLQTYDLRHGLNLVFLSRPQTPEYITATCGWGNRMIAAWGGQQAGRGKGVWIFKRGRKDGEIERPPESNGPIEKILVLGSWIVGTTGSTVEIWKASTYEYYATLIPHQGRNDRTGNHITGICHMPTFLNKIFLSTRKGHVEIWNVSTARLVYTVLPASTDSGAITAIEPTPALFLLAIAYENGSLIIHDVQTDRTVLQLRTKSSNRKLVCSISFRTDGIGAGKDGTKEGVMATASSGSGDITMWDLNGGGRIVGVLRGAHELQSSDARFDGGVNKIECLPGQPVLVSTGLDNALRTWIFDQTPFSTIPRILHSRRGHGAPVTQLKFLPASSEGADSFGKWLLSAAKDRSFWGFSLRRDGQSTEISQGAVQKRAKINRPQLNGVQSTSYDLKAPEITCIACSLNRDGGMGDTVKGPIWANAIARNAEETQITGWESVVTAHRGDKYARTWFWGMKRAGRWAFETSDGSEVTSVSITSCGTFAIVGSALGAIDVFNLQSGIHRQRFPSKLTPAYARKLLLLQPSTRDANFDSPQKFRLGEGKHTKAVTGVMVDGLNRTMISCGLDGKIKFWEFVSGELLDELDWCPTTAITALRYNSSSDLIALSCDDLSIRVLDIETKKVVREFWGCIGQINDICFSNDGRWIVATSMDSIIRVWDLPTGHLIDAFRTRSTCTAVAFSETGEFLAAALADSMGVDIWNNRSLFTGVPTRHISEDEIQEIQGPTASGEGGYLAIDAAFELEMNNNEVDAVGGVSSVRQLSQNMLTLSIVPKSRWQTLIHLDTIKQRNKPVEPPKSPEKAPFFIPSSLTSGAVHVQQQAPDESIHAEFSTDRKKISSRYRTIESQFTSLLRSCTLESESTFDSFVDHLKSLSPSTADLEIRSLHLKEMPIFIEALTNRLRQKRDYEIVNAWMTVFLRLHGDEIVRLSGTQFGADSDSVAEGQALIEGLKEWKLEQMREGKRLADLVGFCGAVVDWVRSERG